MTMFEEFAKELGVAITVDEYGLYTGMIRGLSHMVNEVILSDDEEVRNLEWEEQKEIVKRNFYKTFPYMKK